jgi:hypothetical protein
MTRPRSLSPRHRLGLVLVGAAVVASALGGCASATPNLDPDTAQALQSGVMAVSTAAAAGDFATAQADLATVRGTLAASADTLTAERTQQIQTAIDLVDADLAAAIEASLPAEPAPTRTPSETPSKTPTPTDTGDPRESDDPEDSDEGEETEPPTEKPDQGKDNPGQCKKKDTCD